MYAPAVWSPVVLGRGCGDDGGREPGDTTSLKHGTKRGEILQRKTGRQRENESRDLKILQEVWKYKTSDK